MPPADADFSFRIVFQKGHGDPRRIFDAASDLIDGFQELDEAITGSVDTTIQPLMVLEDIEAGSIRVWLSSFLKKIDDQGLAAGEYKKAIGPALVDAKYAVISYLDKTKDEASQGVDDLRDALRQIAASTDLRHLGDYPPIHEAKLVAALDSIQDAKRLLEPRDKLLLEAPGKNDHQVNLSQTWDPSEVISLEKITTEKHGEGEVILTIRRPDMTGKAQWQFTRGKFAIFAKITDTDWLNAFHARKVPGFRSGDAMRCKVKFIYVFDEKGSMIEERIEVTKVLEIMPGPGGEQIPMTF